MAKVSPDEAAKLIKDETDRLNANQRISENRFMRYLQSRDIPPDVARDAIAAANSIDEFIENCRWDFPDTGTIPSIRLLLRRNKNALDDVNAIRAILDRPPLERRQDDSDEDSANRLQL